MLLRPFLGSVTVTPAQACSRYSGKVSAPGQATARGAASDSGPGGLHAADPGADEQAKYGVLRRLHQSGRRSLSLQPDGKAEICVSIVRVSASNYVCKTTKGSQTTPLNDPLL